MSRKLRCVAPATRTVYPGRLRSWTVRHPPTVIAFSATNHSASGAMPVCTAFSGETANSSCSASTCSAGRSRPTLPTSVQSAPSRFTAARPRGSVRHHSSAAFPPKETPNAPSARDRDVPEATGSVGVEQADLTGDERQVGRLEHAHLSPCTERLVVVAALRSERAGHGLWVHRDDPSIAEHGHGRFVRVVDTDDDVAVTRQLLGEGAVQQRREPADRHQQHRVLRVATGERCFLHGVGAHAIHFESEELRVRSPTRRQVLSSPRARLGGGRVPHPHDQFAPILGVRRVDLGAVLVHPLVRHPSDGVRSRRVRQRFGRGVRHRCSSGSSGRRGWPRDRRRLGRAAAGSPVRTARCRAPLVWVTCVPWRRGQPWTERPCPSVCTVFPSGRSRKQTTSSFGRLGSACNISNRC